MHQKHTDEYLSECLPAILQVLGREGKVGRFFFIRMGVRSATTRKVELRLRFLPVRLSSMMDNASEQVRRIIIQQTQRFWRRSGNYQTADEPAIVCQPYCRSVHYFGENAKSVYAELLNEQTSYLALKLLRKYTKKPRVRFVCLVCMLEQVLEKTFQSEEERRAQVAKSQKFADTCLRENGWEGSLWKKENTAQATQSLRGGTRPFREDPNLNATARLLQRLLRELHDGQHVATHALHLICNKCGFTASQELHAFQVLDYID